MSVDIYIFGSTVRGEVKSNSDIDVLVVTYEEYDRSLYPDSWSVYPKETILNYFKEGRLFAWHLYLDAKCIFSDNSVPIIEKLGMPNKFTSLKEDFYSLKMIITTSLSELKTGTESSIFELGVIYTALRDIAMVLSTKLLDRPCFSRYSPYFLPTNFPIPKNLYESMIEARLNSTRGIKFSKNSIKLSQDLLSCKVNDWLKSLEDII